MTATRTPRPIPLSIHAEDLLVAAAVLAALGDRPGRAHLRKLADRLDRCCPHLLAATTPRRRQR